MAQSSLWKFLTSPKQEPFRIDRSKGKVKFEVFFDSKSTVYHEFISQGHNGNKTMYGDTLCCLRDAICWKRLELWWAGKWAFTHQYHLVNEYLAQDVTMLLQLPHFSELVPADHYPFSQLRERPKGRRFASSDDNEAATKAGLIKVTKNGQKDCFQQWYHHWQRCVTAKGR